MNLTSPDYSGEMTKEYFPLFSEFEFQRQKGRIFFLLLVQMKSHAHRCRLQTRDARRSYLGTAHFKRAKNDAAESNDTEIAAPNSVNRSLLALLVAPSLPKSNAASVAIFSHNSAAKNAQKEAKGGSAPLRIRIADNPNERRGSKRGF